MPTLCHSCQAPARLRKRTKADGGLLFTLVCPACQSKGQAVTGAGYWLKHRDVYDLLEPHGSPFELVTRIPEL